MRQSQLMAAHRDTDAFAPEIEGKHGPAMVNSSMFIIARQSILSFVHARRPRVPPRG
ncbi:MAG: hypothetical protein NTAFB09_23700 [Nitrosospira sp.]